MKEAVPMSSHAQHRLAMYLEGVNSERLRDKSTFLWAHGQAVRGDSQRCC
jgi:hypothetical protein